MQKIAPFLWFNNNAEDALTFYSDVFKNSKTTSETRYPKGTPGLEGMLMTASMVLEGQPITLLNGGPQFKFTEAISFVITCHSQEEVDYYWRS